MINKWHQLKRNPLIHKYNADFLLTNKYFGNIHYSDVLHSILSIPNFYTKDKPKFWKECNQIVALDSSEINTKLTLEPMTDKATDVIHFDRTKVKKSTRKTHLEKSFTKLREDSISPFPSRTNPKENFEGIGVARFRRSVQTKKDDDAGLRLKVRFSINSAENSNERNDAFIRHLTYQLAKRMRVPIPSIQDLTLISGTNVTFTLSPFNDDNFAMDDDSVFEAADYLKMKIRSQQLRLTDLKGQLLMTTKNAYISMDDNTFDFSVVILIVLCVTIVMVIMLIIAVVYIARRLSRVPKTSSGPRNKVYRNMDFGRDSSQSIGKYSYDSGLWLGPGPEPAFTVPDAPYYRPPTVEQIASTPRPVTAVRTRLKRNWDVDERALSTIPDDHGGAQVARIDHRH